MNILSELLFSAGVSVDGFTIGCTYGMRNLRSRFITNIISALICGIASAVAIFFGKIILCYIPKVYADYAGIVILLVLGLFTIFQSVNFGDESDVINCERKISLQESVVLSLTVAADAFSAGLGYAIMGHTSALIPVAVGFFHSFFISLGMGLSLKIIKYFNISRKLLTVFSGSIIIILAVTRLF